VPWGLRATERERKREKREKREREKEQGEKGKIIDRCKRKPVLNPVLEEDVGLLADSVRSSLALNLSLFGPHPMIKKSSTMRQFANH